MKDVGKIVLTGNQHDGFTPTVRFDPDTLRGMSNGTESIFRWAIQQTDGDHPSEIDQVTKLLLEYGLQLHREIGCKTVTSIKTT